MTTWGRNARSSWGGVPSQWAQPSTMVGADPALVPPPEPGLGATTKHRRTDRPKRQRNKEEGGKGQWRRFSARFSSGFSFAGGPVEDHPVTVPTHAGWLRCGQYQGRGTPNSNRMINKVVPVVRFVPTNFPRLPQPINTDDCPGRQFGGPGRGDIIVKVLKKKLCLSKVYFLFITILYN